MLSLRSALSVEKHAAVGQHDFQPQHQVAHHPVAHDAGPARIGRQVAADLARAFGAEAQGKETIDLVGRALHVRKDAARFGDERVVERDRRCGCDSAVAGRARPALRIRPEWRRRSSRCCLREGRRRCGVSLQKRAAARSARPCAADDRQRAPVIQLAMVREKRRDVGGVGEDLVRARISPSAFMFLSPLAADGYAEDASDHEAETPAPAPISTMRKAPFRASRPVKRLNTIPIQNSATQVSAAVISSVRVPVLPVARKGISGTAAPRAKETNEDSAAPWASRGHPG